MLAGVKTVKPETLGSTFGSTSIGSVPRMPPATPRPSSVFWGAGTSVLWFLSQEEGLRGSIVRTRQRQALGRFTGSFSHDELLQQDRGEIHWGFCLSDFEGP